MENTEPVMLSPESECKTCAAHRAKEAESQETSMAFLLALVPVMVLTFFGQVGLL